MHDVIFFKYLRDLILGNDKGKDNEKHTSYTLLNHLFYRFRNRVLILIFTEIFYVLKIFFPGSVSHVFMGSFRLVGPV